NPPAPPPLANPPLRKPPPPPPPLAKPPLRKPPPPPLRKPPLTNETGWRSSSSGGPCCAATWSARSWRLACDGEGGFASWPCAADSVSTARATTTVRDAWARPPRKPARSCRRERWLMGSFLVAFDDVRLLSF